MGVRKSQWELVIDWLDNNRYLHLPKNEKEELKSFRSQTTYITKLERSVKRDESKVTSLGKHIKKRKDKIKGHKSRGKKLYQNLVRLKSRIEIDVYYVEGFQWKSVNDKNQNRLTNKRKVKKQYPQISLNYRFKHTTKMNTIRLGSSREKILKELMKFCPRWYSVTGSKLHVVKGMKKEGVSGHMVRLFTPIVLELLRDKRFKGSIKFDDLKNLMKTKTL